MSPPAPRRLRAAVLGLLTLLAVLFTGAVAAPAAVAGVCQTCDPPGPQHEPTTDPNPPTGLVTEKFTIKTVRIADLQDDAEAPDEVYITFRGAKIWGPTSIGLGGTAQVNVTRFAATKPNTSAGTLAVWEADTNNADDWIGQIETVPTSTSEIVITWVFQGSDAVYYVTIASQQV
jgi:hypothetical protein